MTVTTCSVFYCFRVSEYKLSCAISGIRRYIESQVQGRDIQGFGTYSKYIMHFDRPGSSIASLHV